MHINLAAHRIEHQAMWHDEQIRDMAKKMLIPAGEHIYQLINHLDNAFRFFSIIRVLDPETMHKKNNFAEKQFGYLNCIFKLSEDYMLMGSSNISI